MDNLSVAEIASVHAFYPSPKVCVSCLKRNECAYMRFLSVMQLFNLLML